MSYMKVKDLIKQLEELPQDMVILLAKDDEGNGYRKLSGECAYEASYDDDTSYSLVDEVGITELTDEDIKDGYTEEDVYEDKCVVIG